MPGPVQAEARGGPCRKAWSLSPRAGEQKGPQARLWLPFVASSCSRSRDGSSGAEGWVCRVSGLRSAFEVPSMWLPVLLLLRLHPSYLRLQTLLPTAQKQAGPSSSQLSPTSIQKPPAGRCCGPGTWLHSRPRTGLAGRPL